MSSLNFLNAAKSAAHNAGKPAATSQNYPPVKKFEEPPPPVVVPEDEEDVVDPEEVDYSPSGAALRRPDNRKFTGDFARIEFADPGKEDEFWQLLVATVGPSYLHFAVTCTYLYDKLITPEYWDLVAHQVLPSIPPIVNVLVETAVESSGSGQEKLITVKAANLRAGYQVQMLVNYWMRILSDAEKIRNKEGEKDPIAKTKSLKADLNGGFSIETGTAKNSQQIYYVKDLSLVPVITKTIEEFIRYGKRYASIPYRNGNIILALYGRGGQSISFHVKVGKENISHIFPLDEFTNQIRKAVKKYIPLVGLCRMLIRRGKNVPSSEIDSFPEKEEWIKDILNQDYLNQVVKFLRTRLAIGVVPGSAFPEHFQKKKILDQNKHDQVQIENANIMDLILEHLPEHWETARAAARNLEDSVKLERDNEKNERIALKEKKRKDKEAAREKSQKEAQDQFNIEIKDDSALESIPSAKKKTKPTKDSEGWFSTQSEGTEQEKPKSEKPKQQQQQKIKETPKKEKVNPSQNLFDLPDDTDNLPTPAEYIASVRDARVKGKPEKSEKSQAQKSKPAKVEKPPKEPAEPKEKKKPKEKKVKQEGSYEKKNVTVVADVPFWQNDLFKPLVYVFGLVSLLSFLYLVLN